MRRQGTTVIKANGKIYSGLRAGVTISPISIRAERGRILARISAGDKEKCITLNEYQAIQMLLALRRTILKEVNPKEISWHDVHADNDELKFLGEIFRHKL